MKKMRKARHILLCLLLIAMICNGCGHTGKIQKKKESNQPKIVVGCDNYPPYSYEDANGRPTGIDIDLAKESLGRLGYNAVFSYIDWEKKKKLLESGEIDCIWSSFSINGREKEYQWTSPYMISRQVVAVNKNSNIYTLADLKGKVVAIQSTTKPEELFLLNVDNKLPQLGKLFSLQNRELIYPFLSKGYADAVAAHETAILQYMKDYDLEYRILDEPLQTVGIGVAFSNTDDRALDKKLSKIFNEMRQDGSLKKIIGKYLEDPQKYLEGDADEK